MNFNKKFAYFDYWLVLAVVVLSIFGIVCIGSAIHINLGEDPSSFYMQMAFFAVGIVIMCVVAVIDLGFFSQFYKLFYAANIILLVLVLLIGTSVNNATRWIRIGPVGIQPSEFAKIIMIVCLGKFIDKNREKINNVPMLLFILLSVMIPVMLIQKQPSLSASLVLLAILGIQLFVAGINMKIIYSVVAVAVPAVALVFLDASREAPFIVDKILRNHQLERIRAFLDPAGNPDQYYQTMKSINAIGSGQFSGKGLYHGTLNQLSYLPEPHNDFIFSVIGEEFGFIGCVFVLALLLFIVYRCIIIAMETRDLFGQLVAAGVGGMIAFQTIVNVGVTTGIIPNTGMPLPFVSYGGSSLWANMIGIGLVLNIGLRRSRSLFEGD